jgi:hypothetical protein
MLRTKIIIATLAALAASGAGAQAAREGSDASAPAPREQARHADRTVREAPPAKGGGTQDADPARSEARRKALADWQEFQALQQRVP